PMNAYERRIIHASLQDDDEVTTYSVGQGINRKVVIALK
ncbi:MAG: R3H domain-containing nucleic acid-binding protein, partial [Clostridia bacterium]|nr:R3H domain-containing nucleic acid-binding protein [Clostridia bacterium]